MPAAEGLVHPRGQQVGLGERIQCDLDLGVEGDLLPVEGRLVGVVLLVMRGEVPGGEVLAQIQQCAERLGGVVGEALPLRQLVDSEPFEQQEIEVPAGQQI